MKRAVTFLCRGLAIYFGSLALLVFLAETFRGGLLEADPIGLPVATATEVQPPGPPQLCPECREEWLLITELIGGNECSHGPEDDSNCPPRNDPQNPFNPYLECFELNNGKPSSNGLPCYCFKCGVSQGCEPQLLMFLAHCGRGTQFNSSCVRNGAANFTFRWKRNLVSSPGPTCNYTQEDLWVPFCGFNANTFAYACKTQNCIPVGEDFEPETSGLVPRCSANPNVPLPQSLWVIP